MKNSLIILSLAILLFSCEGNKEELTVTTEKVSGSVLKSTFKVWGNCETCKENIESALKSDGINTADWSPETKMLAITYDSTKITLDVIEKNIAAVGYDNIKYKGDNEAYANLPECCKYERK